MSKLFIQCVIVLYQCPIEQSKAFCSLSSLLSLDLDPAPQIALLIYDNSPSPQQIPPTSFPCETFKYLSDINNSGLAAAYNEAIKMAQQIGAEWLLLLDQDTVLDHRFLSMLLATLNTSLPQEVSAIIPKLVQDGRSLSPQLIGTIRNHPLPPTASGLQKDLITAFNSASCLRVSAVEAIGGFPHNYQLDFLDHAVFHRLQASGGKVFLMDIALEHRLSLVHLEEEMSHERYAGLLAAEWQFVRETGWGGGQSIHRLRLLRRALKNTLILRDKQYALIAFRAIVR